MFSRILYVLLTISMVFSGYAMSPLSAQEYKGFSDVPPSYSIGPDNADVTIVEFMSYECPYCRQIHATIVSAVLKDKNVKYVPRPLPSKNPEALYAAALAYAAGMQGQFISMHNTLLKNFRGIDASALNQISRTIGIDVDRLNEDLAKDEIGDRLMENGRLFSEIGGKATPTFIINENVIYVPGAKMPTVDDFLEMFNNARKAQQDLG